MPTTRRPDASGPSSPGTSGRFRFHLPNLFSRADQTYEALPAGAEDDEAATALADGPLSDDEGEQGAGAEGTRAWREMSKLHRGATWAAFGVLGAAVLLPFNALITPSEYYRGLLVGTPYAQNFMSWIVVVYNCATIIFGAHATLTMERTTPLRRMLRASLTIFFSLVAITTYVYLHEVPKHVADHAAASDGKPRVNKSTVMPALLGITFLMALSTSYIQMAVISLASTFGSRSMGSVLSGQGIVGAAVSFVQLFATLNAQHKVRLAVAAGVQPAENAVSARRSAIVFFSWASVFMLFAIVTMVLLSRTALYTAVRIRQERARQRVGGQASATAVLEPEDPRTAGWEHGKGFGRYLPASWRKDAAHTRAVQSRIVAFSVAMTWLFTITLALFPALSSRVRPWPLEKDDKGSIWNDPLVFVALHYVVFNISDLVGRTLPTLAPRWFLLSSRRAIIFWCGMRELFIPLFKLCNIEHASTPSPSPAAAVPLAARALAVLATSASAAPNAKFGDAAFFTMLALLGISNGLISTSIFVSGPLREGVRPEERGTAAGILSFWLTAGLSLGSFASFFWP